MMEGPRHQHLHQEWQEPLEERGGEGGGMPMRQAGTGIIGSLEHPVKFGQSSRGRRCDISSGQWTAAPEEKTFLAVEN